jgi:hypothetical protein
MAGVAETRTWDALLTSTLANYGDKKLHDQIFDDLPLLSWFDGKLAGALKREKLKKLLDGGESIVVRVQSEASSAIKSYVGYEALDLTPQEGQTIARFTWRQKAGGISISGLERRSNSGDAKLGDLLEDKIQQCEMTMSDTMSRDFWGSNGDAKSVDGLGIILDTAATCGGLAPATYTFWKGTSTASGSFAAQGLKDMRTLYNTISLGQDTPDGLFTTQTIFEYYENALQPLQRYTDESIANSGFENLKFKGKPLFFDRDCTSGQVVMLNSKHIKLHVHKDADMTTTPFVTPDGQDASSATILWMGNMIVRQRRKLGRLTAVTA